MTHILNSLIYPVNENEPVHPPLFEVPDFLSFLFATPPPPPEQPPFTQTLEVTVPYVDFGELDDDASDLISFVSEIHDISDLYFDDDHDDNITETTESMTDTEELDESDYMDLFADFDDVHHSQIAHIHMDSSVDSDSDLDLNSDDE